MSYEIATESLPRTINATPRRSYGVYRAGLGALPATGAFATLTRSVVTAPATVATAPWMQGLPRAGDSKDNTRIAYAKRDHDLAISGNATAYNNLKSQAAGSATAVGKAWYRAALADVDAFRARSITKAPTPPPPPTPSPLTYVQPTIAVLKTLPIVQQATDMGLKVQQTSDGKVVAVNSDGAVVSKPLPVPVSAVTDSNVIPANTVQAAAPPAPPTNRSAGIFSIFDKLTDAITGGSSSSGGSSFVASQGPPPMSLVPDSAVAPLPGTQPTTPNLFSNPIVLVGGALMVYLLFASSHGGRR